MGLTVTCRAAAILLLMSAGLPAAAEFAAGDLPNGPLKVRNLSPITQLYGMPRMSGNMTSMAAWNSGASAKIVTSCSRVQ